MGENIGLSDRELLDQAMAKVQELQALATKYGIDDIFQDNGGKVLQSLIILGLKQLPGREGNDATDDLGREYELKTINILKQQQVTTHHHLNLVILAKYRAVAAWYISLYEGIVLREIYRVETIALEPLFSQWETRIRQTGTQLNNPKIPLKLVRKVGSLVYQSPLSQQKAPTLLDTMIKNTETTSSSGVSEK